MSYQPIGVLDSGLGGLTIWKEIVTLLPYESTIYIADSIHSPYGGKTSEEVYKLVKRLVTFLFSRNIKLLVLACNTITVSCIDRLREDYPQLPIIGTVPVIKTAAEKTKSKRIGIFSTGNTAESKSLHNLITQFASDCQVVNIGSNDLVPLIERGEIGSPKMQSLLRKILIPFQQAKIDVLALGCTHYPLIKEKIQAVMGQDVLLLDSGSAIARQVLRVLSSRKDLANGISTYRFYTTGDKERFEAILKENILKSKYIDAVKIQTEQM